MDGFSLEQLLDEAERLIYEIRINKSEAACDESFVNMARIKLILLEEPRG